MEPARTNLPQIDGLRCYAVIAVLVHHFWRGGLIGHLGVRIFFIISGFLITGLLLDARRHLAKNGLFHTLKTFYARRALRIFPPYYAVLAVATLLSLGDVRETVHWHALYLSNMLFTLRGEWGWPTAHLWSLSVEEQFYMIWPFVILLVPQRALNSLLVMTIVASVAFRALYFGWASGDDVGIWVATPAAFDALALGGLLARWYRGGQSFPSSKTLTWLFVPAVILAYSTSYLSPENFYVWGELVWLLPLSMLVAGATVGFSGIFRHLLGNTLALWIGRMSYGIYLYHLFVWAVLGTVLTRLDIDWAFAEGPRTFLIMSLATILTAAASWYLFEAPLGRLKRRFPTGVHAGEDESGKAAFPRRPSS